MLVDIKINILRCTVSKMYKKKKNMTPNFEEDFCYWVKDAGC